MEQKRPGLGRKDRVVAQNELTKMDIGCIGSGQERSVDLVLLLIMKYL